MRMLVTKQRITHAWGLHPAIGPREGDTLVSLTSLSGQQPARFRSQRLCIQVCQSMASLAASSSDTSAEGPIPGSKGPTTSKLNDLRSHSQHPSVKQMSQASTGDGYEDLKHV